MMCWLIRLSDPGHILRPEQHRDSFNVGLVYSDRNLCAELFTAPIGCTMQNSVSNAGVARSSDCLRLRTTNGFRYLCRMNKGKSVASAARPTNEIGPTQLQITEEADEGCL